MLRYRTAAENAERIEDELKAEKRKLQREVTHFLIDSVEKSTLWKKFDSSQVWCAHL